MSEQIIAKRNHRFIDRTNQRFGRLVAVHYDGNGKWLLRCDCGAETVVPFGSSRSCGCLKRDKMIERNTKHGYAERNRHSAEYVVWSGMRARCRDKNHFGYKWYGGRGIAVCKRWDDFGNFIADMGSRPSPKHTIDRIDGNKNYEPGNCRWATRRDQAENQRNNRMVMIDGISRPLIVLAREAGINSGTLRSRLENGMDIKKAMSAPIGVTYEWNGKRRSLTEWAKQFGIKYHTLVSRICRLGWSFDRAAMTPTRGHDNG